MRKAVAIDFDDTLAVTDFPTIIAPIPAAVKFVKDCQSAGIDVILWTCRTDKHLKEALWWCLQHGIEFDAVNDNLPNRVAEYHALCPDVNPNGRKISCDLYLDDKAFLDWPKAWAWLRAVTEDIGG